MRADTLSELLATLYDCVLAPERWSETLPHISTFGESTASSIVVQDRDAGGARVFEHGADQSFLRLYFEKLVLAQRRPVQRLGFEGVGDIATMTMLAGEREVLNSDFYIKWVQPLGFRDVIGVFVLKSGRRVGWFSLARSDVQSRYGERDLQLLGLLSPHVCRALLISDALELQTIASARLEEAVDVLSTGVFLTEGEHGHITYMNSSAERLLDGGALSARNGRLTTERTGGRDALSQAIAKSAAGKAPPATGRYSVALPDSAGGLIANVLPLSWREGRNPLSGLRGGTAIFVQDPATPAAILLDAFARLYGLTESETKVLDHIGRAHTPQETADALGVSLTTVKTHLQKLFAKTATSRQAELIQLLARSTPPLRSK
jgi:DNA-binding CsgD family transcriptional regulator/PAS domain-containing protein